MQGGLRGTHDSRGVLLVASAGESNDPPLVFARIEETQDNCRCPANRCILVAEDEYLIVMSLTEALPDAGSVVGVRLLRSRGKSGRTSRKIDAAVLDVNLGGRMNKGAGAGGAVCRFHMMAMIN
jgi:hypothetical protein